MTVRLVLVHGAWASDWVWDPVVRPLRDRGFDVATVRLPDASGPESEAGLEHQAARVAAAVDDHAGPVVLVGHSGGGIPITTVAERMPDRIAGVVFVAGIMLPSGVGFDDLRAEVTSDPAQLGAAPFVVPALDGRGTVIPSDAAVRVLFARSPIAGAVAAARRLQPQWNAGLDIVPEWTAERFGRVPRLYVEAEFDDDIPLAIQRHMQARSPGARVIGIPSDHAPMLSAPDDLVDALTAFAHSL